MDEFDKEFDSAPDAAFDDEFEKAEPINDSGIMNAAAEIGSPIAETAYDTMKGAQQGVAFGGADEIEGVSSTIFEKLMSAIPGTAANNTKNVDNQLKAQGFSVPEESLADTFRRYQKASEQEHKDASDRSPVMNTVGNIGGSVLSGIAGGNAIGNIVGKAIPALAEAKGAKTSYDMWKDKDKLAAIWNATKNGGKAFAKASPLIAAEGALLSEGTLDDEAGRDKMLGDAGGALAFGLPAMLGMNSVSEIAAPMAKSGIQKVGKNFDEFAEGNPFLRKYKIGMEHGANKFNPVSEAGVTKLESEQMDRSKGLLKDVFSADKKLGKDVGEALSIAEARGARVNVAETIGDTMESMKYSYQNLLDVTDNARGRKIFDKIADGAEQLTPTDAKYLLDDVDSYIERFGAMKTPGPLVEQKIIPGLMKFRTNLSNQIKKEIPEYGMAAQRFAEHRQLVPETIMAKERPADVSQIFMGSLKNQEKPLYDALNELQLGATAQGSGATNIRKAFANTKAGMQQFEANEALRNAELIKQGKAPNANPLSQNADSFGKQIRDYSDQAQFLKDMQTVKSPVKSFSGQGLVSGTLQLGHSGALASSLAAGRVKKPLVDISRKAYNLPADKLNGLADLMTASPGLKTLGQALKAGLQNGDQAKKNAAIFSMLQNPDARLLFTQDDDKEN